MRDGGKRGRIFETANQRAREKEDEMPVSETQRELIGYLDSLTRDVRHGGFDRYTTASIASAISVSRNLASQYLNGMVRLQLAVKVGARPVYYFHKRTLERVFQTRLESCSFDSIEELLQACGSGERADFSTAIGHDASLRACIEQCKAAMKYPPAGLPLLIVGAPGTGKSLLGRLSYEYCLHSGIVKDDASFISVDCSRFQGGERSPLDYLAASGREAGAFDGARDVVVLFKGADRLQLQHVDELIAAFQSDGSGGRPTRCRAIFTASDVDTPATRVLMRKIPMRARVPRYRDRPVAEREELVRTFFTHEGHRIGADVMVSQGAFRLLADADFSENIRELQSCITNCCADAYLKKQDERLEIHIWQLPTAILCASSNHAAQENGSLLNVADAPVASSSDSGMLATDQMIHAYEAYCLGGDRGEFVHAVQRSARDFEDYLVFNGVNPDARVAAYERLLDSMLQDIGQAQGIDFTRKHARVMALELCSQLWPWADLARWKYANQNELPKLFQLLAQDDAYHEAVLEQVAQGVHHLLGVEPDSLTKILMLAGIQQNVSSETRRQAIGIVVSHGYATASSIADAANRILNTRVFEALDMPYDQQISDIITPLKNLLSRYAYCNEVAILVDMGSLEQIHRDLAMIPGFTLGVINNASTGLAVEIGAGLIAGRGILDVLSQAAQDCTARYTIIDKPSREPAIVFCSEGGADAAEKIKSLFIQSFASEVPVHLIAYDVNRLIQNGRDDALFSTYEPIAVIGTLDPHIDAVEYIALEDIISNAANSRLDQALAPFLTSERLEEFHQHLLKTLTLRNVVESITILNPTRLFDEIEQAVGTLQELLGDRIDERATIGLYVHLCCLVERLVTRTPIEAYVDERAFVEQHQDFIEAFKRSFQDISTRYNIEVPESEIAYVYDYIRAPRFRLQADATALAGEDE